MRIGKRSVVIATFLVTIGSLLLVPSWSTKNAFEKVYEALKFLSQQEQSEVEQLCRHLIGETEFGYTLFGDKPVSRFEVKPNEKLICQTLPILKRVLSHAPLKNFILEEYMKNNRSTLYLVNKKAAVNTILKNHSLFKGFLPNHIAEDQLVDFFFGSEAQPQILLKKHTHLLGVLLGYGSQNVLNFACRKQILGYFKGIIDRPISYLELLQIRYYLDEIKILEEMLKQSTTCVIGNSSRVFFPVFECDPEDKETKTLLKKYKQQQILLQHVFDKDDVALQCIQQLIQEDL